MKNDQSSFPDCLFAMFSMDFPPNQVNQMQWLELGNSLEFKIWKKEGRAIRETRYCC